MQRLRQVLHREGLAPRQVGHRSCQLQRAVVRLRSTPTDASLPQTKA